MKKVISPTPKTKAFAAPNNKLHLAANHLPFSPEKAIENWRKWMLLILAMLAFYHISAQDYVAINKLMQAYDFQNVIEQIDKLKESDSDVKLLTLKANALKGLNKYQEAIDVYEQLHEIDSSEIANSIELAKCYQSLGNFKVAQVYYQKAIAINPDNHYLYQQLGDVYFQDEANSKAIENYFIVYEKDSTYYLSKQLAKSFEKLQKTDTAIYYYERAINLNPNEFITSYNLANLLKKKEEYKHAIVVAESFLKFDSTNLRMLKLHGYLNFMNKSYPTAITSFEKCILGEDTSEFTTKYLAFSYFKVEDYQKAKDYFELTYLKDTTDIQICYALGLSCDYSIYKKLGIHYLSKTIELSQPKPEFLARVYKDLAAANTGLYLYEDALDAYLKAYELQTNDTLLIFKIARHYDRWIKDKEKALNYYQVFMATRPKEKEALPDKPKPEEIVVSYYDFVERRMGELKEELFWQGK